MTTRALAAPVLLLVAVLSASGCSSDPAPGEQEDLSGGAKNYSLTQTITNNSAMDLSVQSVRADNGGTVESGYPTVIRAGTPGTFRATNVGNGVQVWVTLTGTGGQTLTVDSDVPRTDRNFSTATLTGSLTALSTGKIEIGGGDNPAAAFTVDACAPRAACVTSSTTGPTPIVGGSSG